MTQLLDDDHLFIKYASRGVYYARDHLESGGGKKNKKFDGGGKKNTNFDGAGGKNEFQLSGAKLKS